MIYRCYYCGLPASDGAMGLAMPMCKCVIPRPASTPPKREWVGLTDEEIDDLDNFDYDGYGFPNNFARAIEAKLKEKNFDPR